MITTPVRRSLFWLFTLTLWPVAALHAHSKPVIHVGTVGSPDPVTGRFVGDVNLLYEVIDALASDPASLGLHSSSAVIELAPGATYTLDPDKSNLGRLELPPDTDLVGRNDYVDLDGDGVWDARPEFLPAEVFADPVTETIIDAGKLPKASYQIGPLLTGPLRIGQRNRVRRLTIRNAPNARALVEIELLPADGGMEASVSSCVIEHGDTGVDFRHLTPLGSDRESHARIKQCVVRHHAGQFGFGIRLLNNGVTGSTLRATIRRNRIYDCAMGLHGHAEAVVAASGDAMEIDSEENIYEGNGVGVGIEAALSRAAPASGNYARFTSRGDAMWNNNKDTGATLKRFLVGGGLVARAGVQGAEGGDCSNNTLDVELLSPRFLKRAPDGTLDGAQNLTRYPSGKAERLDLWAFGAFVVGSGAFSGDGNRVDVLVTNAGDDPVFRATDSSDPAAASRNTAHIIASDEDENIE